MDTLITPAADRMPTHVVRMVALIQARAAGPLSLRTLADALGRQEAYLGRLFRQQMGMSVREYVAQLRLDRAAERITQGEKVEAVALAVGYRSKKSFYRQFVRRFGSTPAAYRARTVAPRPSSAPAGAPLQNLTFRQLGPALAGGRITAIDGREDRPATLYVTASTSGLWETHNNGTTWTPLWIDESRAPVATIAVAPSNPQVLWLGTGEAGVSPLPGDGVHRSLDGGATWARAGLADAPFVGRILVDPRDADSAYTLVSGHAPGASARNGMYKTTDGGNTWTPVLPAAPGTIVTDVVIDPSAPDVSIAAVSREHGHAPVADDKDRTIGGLYKSEDGGRTWTRVSAGLPSGTPTRAALGLCEHHSGVLYLALTFPSRRVAVFRSLDRGCTWERRQVLPGHVRATRLRVDPHDPERVYLLGDRLRVSDDGGRSFRDRDSARARAGYQTLWIDPADASHLVSGSQEGVSVSYDRARSWHLCRNLPLARVSRVAVDLNCPYRIYVGIEGDGAWVGPSATRTSGIDNEHWSAIPGGAVLALPDPTDGRSVYTQTPDGCLVHYNPDTGEHRAIRRRGHDEGTPDQLRNTALPLIASRYAPSTIYLGTNRVLRSTDHGVWWTPISPDLCVTLTALAESGKAVGLLYAGSHDRRLFVCRGVGAPWIEASDGLRDVPQHAWVSRIATSWSDEETAYVAFDGSRSDDRAAYLFMTRDAGRSWSPIAGDLPPAPIHVVYEDPRQAGLLYAGTDLGLFVSFDRGSRWVPLECNLPRVPVMDVLVHPRENDLVVGTRGRGLWILDDATALQGLSDEVLHQEAHLFAVRAGIQVVPCGRPAWRGDDAFSAPNPPCGTAITYYLRDMAAGSVRLTIKDERGVTVRKLDGGRDPGMHRVVWDLRSPSPRHGGVRATSANRQPPMLLGPFVPPGSYDVALIVSGKHCGHRPCRVETDPLVDVPEPARELQQHALVVLTQMQVRLIGSIEALRSLTRQLGAVYERLQRHATLPGITVNATGALVRRVSALRHAMGWYPPTAHAPGGRHTSLGACINRLKGEIAGSASAPTPAQSTALNRLRRDLSHALAAVRTILSDELPALNRQLESQGLSPVRMSIRPSQLLALRESGNAG